MKTPQQQTMRAVMYETYGGPDKLSLRDVPIPRLKPDELLVEVHATSVNRTDCGFLRAKPWVIRFVSGLFKPKAQILGCEFAGVVVAIGSEVKDFSAGERVTGFKDDDHGLGGHAQYTSIPESAMVARIPNDCDFQTAAVALEGAHYALHGIRAANVSAGQAVLVNGATGAIGSAAVQILKAMGARVVAVCGTEHIATVQSLGADRVIDYQSEDFTECGELVDLVCDAVGKSNYFDCRKLLNADGAYTSSELGDYCQNPLLALWTSKFSRRKVLFPIPENSRLDAEYLCQLMQDGHYKPLIDRTYPLEETRDAVRYVETGTKIGNVVIEVQ